MSQNVSLQMFSSALTLKKRSFLFLLRYKAESIFAGMLVKRFGKPRSSLKSVYLHTLSPLINHVQWKKRGRVRILSALHCILCDLKSKNTIFTFQKIRLSRPLGVHSGTETPRQLLPDCRDQDGGVVARIRHRPHMLTTENIRLVQRACRKCVRMKENWELFVLF